MKARWTDIFIRRPVIAWAVNVLLIIVGLQALWQLNVRQYPLVESTTIEISTVFVGADAQKVRGFITTPIERAIAAADGIDYVESSSVQGNSTIKVRLELDYPAEAALADIGARVDKVKPDLPEGAYDPVLRAEPSDGAVASMYIAFTSDALPENVLTDQLERTVIPRLSGVEGVQRAELSGAQKLALRIWLDPDRMAALNVAPSDVRTALANNHYVAALGHTRGDVVNVDLRATSDLGSVKEFEALVVRRTGDAVVRLADVSTVALGAEDYDTAAHASGERAIFCGVWVQADASALEVARAVHAELDLLSEELGESVQVDVPYDATVFIDDSLNEVGGTLAETIVIVIVVILLFLGSLRAALAPLVVIPLSLLGGVFLMQVMGFSVNLLTLLAIVLAVGLVVDDAIVVIEKVDFYVREGRTRLDAAVMAARELIGPVFAMTVTLAAVYAPIGLQGGLTGALFREFAFTLAGTVCISGVVALTLSPMMAAKTMRREDAPTPRLAVLSDRAFTAVRDLYTRALDWSLARRRLMLSIWVVLSLLVAPLYMLSPKELAPLEDQSSVFVAVDLPPNAPLEAVDGHARGIDQAFANIPEFESGWRLATPSSLFAGIELQKWGPRTRSIGEIHGEVAAQVSMLPGIRATAFQPSALPSPGTYPIEFVLVSHRSHEELLEVAMAVRNEAAETGLFAYPPTIDLLMDQENASVELDRLRIANAGLDLRSVGSGLNTFLSGDHVAYFDRDGRSYKIIPQLERDAQQRAEQLADLQLRGPNDTLVPLSSLATLDHDVDARSLNRFNQFNAVRLSGFPTRSLDEALTALEQLTDKHGGDGITYDHAGESRQLRQEAGKFLPAIAMAIVLVFLVLAAQFNSFRDPFVVLAGSVPLAMFGALVFSFLHFSGPPGMEFPLTSGWTTSMNIYSQVGLVTLVGLVAKNGILIVEHAKVARESGMSKLAAIRDAASVRFRPIMMTTVATVVGHFPLVLVSGPGASARNSIGLILVGGMLWGTLLTLFIVPSIYVTLSKSGERGDEG